jgi:HlyD family secretion protein
MSRTRLILIAVGAVAIVAAVALSFRPRPVAVEASRVERGPLLVTVEAEGVSRVMDRFVVSAPIAGLARRIPHEVGDPVRAGEVIALIEPMPSQPLDAASRAAAEARVRAADAGVARADASVRQADQRAAQARSSAALAAREYERVAPLGRDSILSPAEVERYADAARQAEAARAEAAAARSAAAAGAAAARHERAAALAVLSAGGARGGAAVAVRAPAAGVVLAVHHESEDTVAPGQPLVEVGDPRVLEVAAEVLSEDAVRLRPGMRVIVDGWGGPEPIEGVLRRVEPVAFTEVSALGVDEQRVVALVDLPRRAAGEGEFPLGHGYRVVARFVLSEGDQVLLAPSSALFREGDGWAVYAVEDGRVRLRRVQRGREAGLMVEIRDGLPAGALVVTHPDDDLVDGVRVDVGGE